MLNDLITDLQLYGVWGMLKYMGEAIMESTWTAWVVLVVLVLGGLFGQFAWPIWLLAVLIGTVTFFHFIFVSLPYGTAHLRWNFSTARASFYALAVAALIDLTPGIELTLMQVIWMCALASAAALRLEVGNYRRWPYHPTEENVSYLRRVEILFGLLIGLGIGRVLWWALP